MVRVVLDTNVLVSGVIASGYSARILDAVRDEKLILTTSAHLMDEFSDVISRRRIVRKYPAIADNAESLLDFVRAFAEFVPGVPEENQISLDPDDDFVLACAVEGDADFIVSGDPHLLDLKTYKGIPILSPREFVEQVLK
ncbi:MAG: putative toxin-antitoxin system toxin component, PIN family [Anaerolineales bacterium]|nr:putative toxin-antitoxin system toxin component, PIN family [Anaerolineales bacterium]